MICAQKSPTGRAACWECGRPIHRGEPRLGFGFNSRFGFKWQHYHARCVRKVLRKSVKAA